ncbi:MAG: DUF2244 domain-containing protein [Oleiphilaceae bacterium]|nr:DUF2244 domain-containing protein [Oleiphilaceae bacterium]
MIEPLQDNDSTSLVLTPNRSLSWQGNLWICLAFAFYFLTVGVGTALLGAWVVFPFAVLELAVLFAGLWVTTRLCYRQQVLTLTPETLRLEKGLNVKQEEWELPRRWTRVYIKYPVHYWKPPRLTLVHRDREVALGEFLNPEDTAELIDFLEKKGFTIDEIRETEIIRF